MKTLIRRSPMLLVACMLAVLTACTGINPAAIKGTFGLVAARHDAYVAGDASLDQADKDVFLAQSATVSDAIKTAEADGKFIKADKVAGSVNAVTGRHDAYVNGDDSLDSLHKEVYLRSSALLRDVVDEALKNK